MQKVMKGGGRRLVFNPICNYLHAKFLRKKSSIFYPSWTKPGHFQHFPPVFDLKISFFNP